MRKRKGAPSHLRIAGANIEMLNSMEKFAYDGEFEMSGVCWACGVWCGKPERAHVVAHSQGGSNDSSNYFLLCSDCHEEQPDGMDRSAQVKWLEAHEPFYSSKLLERRYPNSMKALQKVRGAGLSPKAGDLIDLTPDFASASRCRKNIRSNVDFAVLEAMKSYVKAVIQNRNKEQ